ncbi:MAG: FAD-binding oxidoreductase [Thermoleophilaceae bacterium]|nr:FAD-binding oxidoreductase [Thermoleophilaceae bacterium]
MTGSVEVAVAGAGIVGCATAWELARRGVRVSLVDRGEVSGGTTGLGEGNVLCSDKAPGPELDLAARGLSLYDEIEELLGESAGIRRKGALIVHPGEDSWAAEPQRLERLRSAGVECSTLTPGDAREAEPELLGTLLGASWFPHDLQCAPAAIARALAREAERLGGAVSTGAEVQSIAVRAGRVEGLDTSNGRLAADTVVLAAGAWSARLARTAGLELPLEPRKGQLVRLERRPGFLRRKVIDASYMRAVADPGSGLQVSTVAETTLDEHMLVGSSRERRGFDLSVDPSVSEAMLRAAGRLMPRIRTLRVDGAWAGLRPWLPGGLPAIGTTAAAEGLWIATGHEGAGVAHGPITGRLIAQGICGEPPELDPAPFDPDRFSRN